MEKKEKNNTVFYISLFISIMISGAGIIFPEEFGTVADSVFQFLTANFSWAYLLAMFIFIVAVLVIAFSKYGEIKLGPDDSTPDFSTASWFAMLFGAGMGIGLVFWGVSEPISHLVSAPEMTAGSDESVIFSLASSFRHWGLHAWGSYSVIGMALAYFQFRKGSPALISSIFEPLIGKERVNGPIGKTIDVLAIFATVAGVATSLGLGTLQINSGFNLLFGLPETNLMQVIIIAVITLIFIWTAVSGIEKGIKVLGDINLYLACFLLAGAFLVGPSVDILNSFTTGLGSYLNNFLNDSLVMNVYGDNSWLKDWTIFYWAWWIAWAPFVGSFIARISRGRTIKEFVLGVIFAPSLASIVWFSTFGTLGISLKDIIGLDKLGELAVVPETALFTIMQHYPFGSLLSVVTIILLCTFFITSANSATFVLGMFSSEGDLNPSNKRKIIWGLVQAFLAAALLLSGGLEALQTASIAAAFPFIFIMLFAIVALVKALDKDYKNNYQDKNDAKSKIDETKNNNEATC